MRFTGFLLFLPFLCGSALAQTATPSSTPSIAIPPPSASPSPTSSPPGAIRGNYGDWQIRCENIPGAQKEQCALVQAVKAQDRPNVGLLVMALHTADQKQQLLQVIAPLGVLLPRGLSLRIDDQNIGTTEFTRCVPTACVAEARLDLTDGLLDKLKNGKTATFIIFLTPEEGIGIPVSLNGFAQGYDNLK